MSSLDKIGVKVVPAAPPMATTGNALPLLHEIAALLQALAERSEEGCIDLRGLPLAPGDYDHLRALLGEGEVQATIDAAGETRVRETAYAGVWWVTHRGPDDEVMAERIEITFMPAILTSHPADVGVAARRLHDDIEARTNDAP